MDASRRRPARILVVAFGLSVLAHAILLPLVRVPAAARAATPQKATVLTLRHARPLPHPTPRPTPMPPPATPRPIVAHPVDVPKHARTVALIAPRAHNFSPSTKSDVAGKRGSTTANGDGSPSDPDRGSGPPGDGSAESTAAPVIEATPAATPAPIESTCPNHPHDATVTQAITPDRPERAADIDAVGRVVVEVRLARDGSVAGASVHQSSGYASLDNAAVDAAAHARYAPASDGCEAIAGTYLYVVDFSE